MTMEKNMIEYTATCLFGLESLLGEEIEALGYTRTQTMDGRISFMGDPMACARANNQPALCGTGVYKAGFFPGGNL